MLILATLDGGLAERHGVLFEIPAARELLARIGIGHEVDLLARRVGDKQLLMPLMNSFPLPANSDFYPYLDLGSAAARYRGARASAVLGVASASVPLRDLFGGYAEAIDKISPPSVTPTSAAAGLSLAANVYAWFVDDDRGAALHLPDDVRRLGATLLAGSDECASATPLQRDRLEFAERVFPHLDAPRRGRIAAVISARSNCGEADPAMRFLQGLAAADPALIRTNATALRETFAFDRELSAYLLEAILFANLLDQRADANLALWQRIAPAERRVLLRRLPLRLLLAHSTRDDS